VYELNTVELSSELDSNNEKCYALHYVPNVFVLIDELDLFHGSARFRLDSLGWSSKHSVHGLFGTKVEPLGNGLRKEGRRSVIVTLVSQFLDHQ